MLNKLILAICLASMLSCGVAFYQLSQPVVTVSPVDNSAVFEAGYQAYREEKAQIIVDNTVDLIRGDITSPNDDQKAVLISKDTLSSIMDLLPPSWNQNLFGDAMQIYHRGYSSQDVYCLAKNIYFEARNQRELGQIVVGLVTVSREKASGRSICQVVHRKTYVSAKKETVCQFSWNCGEHHVDMDNIIERNAWYSSLDLSKDILEGKYQTLAKTTYKGVLHYHTKQVSPRWDRKMVEVAEIGNHIFYR